MCGMSSCVCCVLLNRRSLISCCLPPFVTLLAAAKRWPPSPTSQETVTKLPSRCFHCALNPCQGLYFIQARTGGKLGLAINPPNGRWLPCCGPVRSAAFSFSAPCLRRRLLESPRRVRPLVSFSPSRVTLHSLSLVSSSSSSSSSAADLVLQEVAVVVTPFALRTTWAEDATPQVRRRPKSPRTTTTRRRVRFFLLAGRCCAIPPISRPIGSESRCEPTTPCGCSPRNPSNCIWQTSVRAL